MEKNYNSFRVNKASIKKSLFAILALLLFQNSSAQLTIPADNAYSSLSFRPLSSSYAYDRINSHYPASDINIEPGSTITNIRYYLESANGPSAIPVRIYMANASGITSFSEIYGNALSGTTLVYSGTIPATSFVTGKWVNITLTNPFIYTGRGLQVLVEANYGSGSGAEFSTSKQFRTSLGSSQTWSSFANPISNNTYGIPLGNKPNLQIFYNTPGYSGNVSFDYNQMKANENTMAIVTVNRNGGSTGAISVNYATSDGTAIAGSDYTGVSGTLTWADGDTAPKTITVPILSDFIFDDAETIAVTLSDPVGTAIENVNPATITIIDVLPPMKGIYTVGTGGNYPSLTNAGGIFQALNTRIAGVSGPITINIISDLTGELGTHALNEIAGDYPILIQPAGGERTISGTNQIGLIRFNGTDNVTIDGSLTDGNVSPCALGGDASLRQLTFISTASTNTTGNGVISFLPGTNGSMNNTVKNINITGTSQYPTNFGVSFGAAAPYNNGMVNQGNKLVNCSIQKVRVAVTSRGISLAEQNSNTIIRNNDFSATGTNAVSGCAISIFSENNPDVSFNTVYVAHGNQINGDATGIGIGRAVANDTAVNAGNVTGALVSNNKIIGVVNNHNSIGFSSTGIVVSGAATGLPNVIQNNMIAGVTGQSQDGSMVTGIHVVGAVASKTKLYHNSIWLTGDRGAQNRNQTPSFCISVTGIDPNLDMRNNIMFIDQIASIGGAVKMFAFGTTSTTFNNLVSDYNTYFSSGPQDFGFRSGGLKINGGTNYATLTDWKLANGADLHSLEVQPNFVSTTDLHLVSGTNPTIDGGGTPIAGITTDFDCKLRNPLTPTMGATETESGVIGYSIAAGAGTNGSITPNGVTTVAVGADQTYTITADCGYIISDVSVDGVSQGAITTYTFTDINANHTITSTFSAVLPTITAEGPTTFCLGGSVVLTSSSETGNVWSTGETTQSITALASGNYWVTVDNGSCNSPMSEPVTVKIGSPGPAPTISGGGGSGFCEGGSATLTSSATTGNLWSTGETTQSIVVTTSGTYTVSYNDGICMSYPSAGTTINVIPREPTPTITASGPTTFCDGERVILTSSAATGNVWSTGATTQSITISSSGSYTVRVRSGCNSLTSEAVVTTVIPNPARPTISVTGSTTFCEGGSVILTSSATEGNLWSNGETTQSITVTTGGVYSVTATANGCTSLLPRSRTITVTPAPATPTISASGATTFCTGGSVILTSSSATGNLWSNGATTQSITVTTSGNYSVSVTSGTCTSALSDETEVTVNSIPATPTISASGTTTFCTGGSVTLTSSASSGNVWSNGETTQSITVSTGGTYTVAVTNNGCSSSTSAGITVTVNPIPATPTISASGITTFCQGGSVTLTSSASSGNLWSNGATTQSITVTTAGNYSVSVTSGTCTSALSDETEVTVNSIPATPTISASGATTFCTGGSVTLTSSASSGNVWSNGETAQSITVSTGGTYTVAVTNNGCSSSTSAGITVTVNLVPATPTISASGATTFCTGGSIVLTSSSATGNLWSNGATTQSITVTTAGNYSVSVTSGTCTSALSDETIVIVNPIPATPTISASGATTFCTGGSVILTSSSSTGNVWSNGETTQSITVSTGGTYTVAVTNNGCSSATSVGTTVIVNPIPATPTISASGATTFCTGGSVILTSSSSTGNVWSNGETTQSITVSTGGTYTVAVTNNGCSSAASAGTTVTVNPILATPTISASGATTFCTGGSVTLTSSASSGNIWSNGATTQSITVSTGGTYTVAVTNNGCSSATSAGTIVTVNPIPTDEVTQNLGIITAAQTGATYRWYSCPNTLIVGATDQTFEPTVIGDYRVEVTLGSCTVISDCITVNTLGNPNFNLNKFEFYPNPVTSILNIKYTTEFTNVEIFNMLGQKVLTKDVNKNTTQIDMSHLSSATYLVKVSGENVSKIIKVVKK